MLSLYALSTASGAAGYYSKDDYYAEAGSARETSEWHGGGAKNLGLEGVVEAQPFENVLAGDLPDGQSVKKETKDGPVHQPGLDLTFSAPKSLSLLALVSGDDRIREVYKESVKKTLDWAEKNLVSTRMMVDGKIQNVGGQKMIAALFEHHTSRAADPNLHIHAVIANMVLDDDGKARALDNRHLWANSTLLGAIIEAFSQLWHDIQAAAKDVFDPSPIHLETLSLISRPNIEALSDGDRATMVADWRARAKDLGFEGQKLINRSLWRSGQNTTWLGSLVSKLATTADKAEIVINHFFKPSEAVQSAKEDPFRLPNRLLTSPADIVAHAATSAALRHLSEREAAFPLLQATKEALTFGYKVTVDQVEKQLGRLEDVGRIIVNRTGPEAMVTTPMAVDLEKRLIALEMAGVDNSAPLMDADAFSQAASENAASQSPLNQEQRRAAETIIGSTDRFINIQGVAGSGKSTMLRAVYGALRAENVPVIGLAQQNTVVQQLTQDAGMKATTVASFLSAHHRLLGQTPDPDHVTLAKAMFRGGALFIDEASQLSNIDQEKLLLLANRVEVTRVVSVGDTKQIGAIEAGKPYALSQQARFQTETMPTNMRQVEGPLRKAADLAHGGYISAAFQTLAPFTKTVGQNLVKETVRHWQVATANGREGTLVVPQSRRLRNAINAAIHEAERQAGRVTGPDVWLKVLESGFKTRAQMSHALTYKKDDIVEFNWNLKAQGIEKGALARVTHDGRDGYLIGLKDLTSGEFLELDPRRVPQNGHWGSIHIERTIAVAKGDDIRWTANDHDRQIFNGARAHIIEADKDTLTVRLANGDTLTLKHSDPMLQRLDLDYARNTRAAQGMTSKNVLAVFDASERLLNSQTNFYVAVSRERESLTLLSDEPAKVEAAVARTDGQKTSALDVAGTTPIDERLKHLTDLRTPQVFPCFEPVSDRAETAKPDKEAELSLEQKSPESGGDKTKDLEL
mgnify:CR=1 FL=1